MNNRTAAYVIGAMAAAAAIIAFVMLFAWSFRADADATIDDVPSLLNPQIQRDARDGYVIAELYQDVRLDIKSRVYDEHGVLMGHHWTHDPARQSCGVYLVLAVQRGIDQPAPTATPRPPDLTATPGPAVVLPAVGNLPDRTVVVLPTATPDGWEGPTPYPTATPSPLISSASWIGWENRPVAIEADGVVMLDVPRDADVSAHLSVWTGYHPTGQTKLATLPLPEADWDQGTARIRLQEASGRILLNRDHIDAKHRSARIRVQAGPLADCHGINLRWEKPAAVVVKALTDQPYADWQDHELPPTPVPAVATLSRLTLTGMTISPKFDPTATTYTASVPYATSETTVRPALASPGNSYTISLRGNELTESAPAVVELAEGNNAITIEVASADGHTTNTYTVTVSRETASSDASLASLTLGGIPPNRWTPAFNAAVHEYDVRVPHSVTRITVLAETTDTAATVSVVTDPADALTDGGYGAAIIELAEGATTTLTVTVTAEDGTTTQDYVVRIHRARATP